MPRPEGAMPIEPALGAALSAESSPPPAISTTARIAAAAPPATIAFFFVVQPSPPPCGAGDAAGAWVMRRSTAVRVPAATLTARRFSTNPSLTTRTLCSPAATPSRLSGVTPFASPSTKTAAPAGSVEIRIVPPWSAAPAPSGVAPARARTMARARPRQFERVRSEITLPPRNDFKLRRLHRAASSRQRKRHRSFTIFEVPPRRRFDLGDRLFLAGALSAAVAVVIGLGEGAWELQGLHWWPYYTADVAFAALLYGLFNSVVGGLCGLAVRHREPRALLWRTTAIGLLSMTGLLGASRLGTTFAPQLNGLPSLALPPACAVALAGAGAVLLRGHAETSATDAGPAGRRWARRAAAALVFVALIPLAAAWWWRPWGRHSGTGAAGSERPNVVLIVMDTVRVDALSCYGNPRKTTPNLDRLAARSLVFDQASATAPWTLPSHASLFTGLYTPQHRVDRTRPLLADGLTTLAEVFGAAGYQSAGFSNNPWVGLNTNFHQGFDLFQGMWRGAQGVERLAAVRILEDLKDYRGRPPTQAERTNHRIRWWLDEVRRPAVPFFLFVNYIDPHFPYRPPEPYRSRFLRPENRDAASRISTRAIRSLPPPMDLAPTLRGALRDLYEGEVASLDAQIGRLIDDLGKRSLADDTIVVLTSDHGENLGDHKLLFHEFSVNETLLRVPLILHYPRKVAPGRVATPVSLSDVYPTLVNLAGLSPTAAPGFLGRDLLAASSTPAGPVSRILAEYTAPLRLRPRLRPRGAAEDQGYTTRNLKSIR